MKESQTALIKSAISSVGKTFKSEAFGKLMEKFEDKIVQFETESKSFQVNGEDSEERSIELGGLVNKMNNAIDKARLAAKRPYLDFGNELDGYVRPVQKRLLEIKDNEKSKCKKYRSEVLRKEREEEIKRLADERAEEQRQEKAKREVAGKRTISSLRLAPSKPVEIKKAEGKVESFTGSSANYKTVPVAKLKDITKVPAKYLTVDWKLVKADLKDGIKDIPGFDIIDEIDMKLYS